MSKKLDLMSGGTDTIIGSGVRVKGNVASEADIVVDGTLYGDLKSAGNVTIGVNGIVRGSIKATNVTIAGRLVGDVVAANETALTASGHLKGDITTSILAIGAGAIFMGKVNMTQTETEILPDQDEHESSAT